MGPPLPTPLVWQYNSNLEARMRYADQPDKFMEVGAGRGRAPKLVRAARKWRLFSGL